MEYKSRVVIIIPVYKEYLDRFEQIALTQLHKILGEYAKCFVAPQGLQIDYGEIGAGIQTEWFDSSYFQSKHTYSRLMMSPEFYERFIGFEYMLIYQLDAFVFSNQLEYFCNLGYDYIGAPVSRWNSEWNAVKKRIGNGGFSLRKVKSCLDLCLRKDEIFTILPNNKEKNKILLWEDIFFAFAGAHLEICFQTPGYLVAQNFAVEHDGGRAYKKMRSGWRPFGCHAWVEIDYWFWRPLIAKCGYELPAGEGKQLLKTREIILQNYAINRFFRYKSSFSYSFLPFKERIISIWGIGKQGRLCYNFVKVAGLEVKCIYDEVVDKSLSMPILKPTNALLIAECYPIIIATTKYEKEIVDRLEQLGKKHGIDFFMWSQLKHNILFWLGQRLVGIPNRDIE